MADLLDPREVTIAQQLECVTREIGYRKRVYPRWVADGKMQQKKADHELKAMEAVQKTLLGLMGTGIG